MIEGRYHLYTGLKEGQKIHFEKETGQAYRVKSDKTYYLIKFWAWPKETYYLCRNHNDKYRYTLFSKNTGTLESPKLRRPIGYGYLSPDLKFRMVIQMTMPFQRIFMDLEPSAITVDSLLTSA